MTLMLVYATAPDAKTAEGIAHVLLDKKLVACVNIIPGVQSVYRWKGKIETSTEVVMIIKTTIDAWPKLQQEFSQNHPYTLPSLSAYVAHDAWPDFTGWVHQEIAV